MLGGVLMPMIILLSGLGVLPKLLKSLDEIDGDKYGLL